MTDQMVFILRKINNFIYLILNCQLWHVNTNIYILIYTNIYTNIYQYTIYTNTTLYTKQTNPLFFCHQLKEVELKASSLFMTYNFISHCASSCYPNLKFFFHITSTLRDFILSKCTSQTHLFFSPLILSRITLIKS